MTAQRTAGRLLTAASLGLALVAACAGAAPPADAQAAWTPDPDADPSARRALPRTRVRRSPPLPRTTPAPRAARTAPSRIRTAASSAASSPTSATPAGSPLTPRATRPAPGASSTPRRRATPARPPPLPAVEIGAPRFENGEVTKVEKSLGKASADLARCVAEHGGLGAEAGSLKVQFLVRFRGRAEGVEILSAKGVSAEAAACVRQRLKNKAIGAPTADPVGVTVTVTFRAAKP